MKEDQGQLLRAMSRLTRAIQAQTEAITALAASNERLADELMADGQDDNEEQPTTRYMDGSPMDPGPHG